MKTYPRTKVAVVHTASVFLDTAATIEKACDLIAEAARNSAELVVFSEAFVPAFPAWSALFAPIKCHQFFRRLAANAVLISGPEIARICAAAREHDIMVSIGINEGTEASVGCIWNSNVLIGKDGGILNHHRKIVPTYFEKLIHANGDGAGLRVVDTSIGRIGALICGENTNPLARYTLMAQGEQIHIATYPPIWPTKVPKEGGNYDLENAIRLRSGAHSFEAKCFTLVSAGYVDKSMRDELAGSSKEAMEIIDNTPRGVSMIIDPTGSQIGDTLCDDEGILYQEIDIADCVEPKQFHDVVGYYNRFDIFKLSVDRSANRPVSFELDGEQLKQHSANQDIENDHPLNEIDQPAIVSQ